jgi:two-component system catabolic regulation response regulator CreB
MDEQPIVARTAAAPPDVPVPRMSGAPATERTGPAPGSRGKILVAEDEPGLAEVLGLHLQAAGYEPVMAGDGLEALYALDREGVRAVLLDLNLPQVSGFRIIQLVKQRADVPSVPVIVITALSFQEAEEAVRAGADDFVTKPFEPMDIVERLERLLARLG